MITYHNRCDETYIFQYDLETKRQSVYTGKLTSSKIKKTQMSKSKLFYCSFRN